MDGGPVLPTLLAAIALLSLNAYVLLAGADFGGGVWDLVASGPRRDAQRALIADAIGPIWEANHVWLILVIVLLFTCFPSAFSGLAIVLHVPLTLMLVGIVLRGSAFTFRSYGADRDADQRRWGRVFAIASTITPVLLGVCVGALASGAVGRALAMVGVPSVNPRAHFGEIFLAPWLTPFTLAVGALALASFSFLAAVYLTVEARDDALRDDFRTRALAAALAVFVTAFGALVLAPVHAPRVSAGLESSAWAFPLHVLTAIAAIAAIAALWWRRYRLARIAAAAQVTVILWGWGAAQFPYLIPPVITIDAAAAPHRTLRLVLAALACGAVVLVPSIAYLFRIFKGPGGREAFGPADHDA